MKNMTPVLYISRGLLTGHFTLSASVPCWPRISDPAIKIDPFFRKAIQCSYPHLTYSGWKCIFSIIDITGTIKCLTILTKQCTETTITHVNLVSKLYEQLWVYSDSTRRADYGYIRHSARRVAKSRSLKLWPEMSLFRLLYWFSWHWWAIEGLSWAIIKGGTIRYCMVIFIQIYNTPVPYGSLNDENRKRVQSTISSQIKTCKT